MNIRALKLSGFMTIVAILATVLAAACGGGEPEELEIPVNVEGGKMSPETIRVKQGDMVTLKIQADDAIEFHLHTYDIKKDLAAGEVVDFFLVADATGRFRITFHHLEEEKGKHGEAEGEHKENGEEEIALGFLEVGPR